MVVVYTIQKGSAKELTGKVIQLLQCLAFFTTFFHFTLSAEHVPGVENGPADSVFRSKMDLFFTLVPKACCLPTPIPAELWQLVVVENLDWLSEEWRALFLTICRKGLQSPLPNATNLL